MNWELNEERRAHNVTAAALAEARREIQDLRRENALLRLDLAATVEFMELATLIIRERQEAVS